MAGPSAPVPEVRLAPDVRTLVLFDAEIVQDSIVLDATRVRLVDAGARSLILQPLRELGAGERLWLRVRFRGGSGLEEAVLVLVSHPSEVDTLIDVTRRARPIEACQAELAETQARCGMGGLTELVLSGALDARGIVTTPLENVDMSVTQGSVTLAGGWTHAGPGWVVLVLRLRHRPGEPLGALQGAVLVSKKSGQRFTVRAVRVKWATPEAEGWVVVEVASPEALDPGLYLLSLSEAPGALPLVGFRFEVPEVPSRASEPRP